MRLPRLTISESIVVVCVLGLACTLPLQCHQALSTRDCKFVAEYHALHARELRKIASHHAAWMDQFRAQLRTMADEEDSLSLRIANSTFYDQRDVDASYDSNMSAVERKQFWLTFNAVAIREGYRKPLLDRGSHRGVDTLDAVCDCWPSALALGVLLLFLRRKHRRGRTCPADEEGYWPEIRAD